ncbi:conserved protein of unknown function [Tepidanaerobacter acetatoxydans Re1]|uniref:Putative Se/S carrier protein-like domain-containing protein n=1 Tax=Tepidanaerobacter acetatoxydans (strain DSM 21804 / JCM 16047 / Re1) TaxID=1209989 RepID=F4LUR2_TEPAE|nr:MULTISPECIES: DUF3343 domain-containing protein [Tepidanaerobacter]AEE90630.1 hypothetical protein TepRe1_0429 [Tepidanaerobacter acetatoxydans Re1]CCP25153.1 conserved protein of unknown function [Tepidanaerobacter acetatoxydans Re1]
MRPKKLQCVVTFQTTTEAMTFEKVAKAAGLSGRIIPLPRAIAAGCGLAWKEDPKYRVLLERLINEHNLVYNKIYELVI